MSRIVYVLLSICANVVLWSWIIHCIKGVWKKKEKFYVFTVIAGIFLLQVFYIYSVLKRQMIYYADYSNYFQIQGELSAFFAQGTVRGIKEFIKSIWFNDYNMFLCIFGGALYELIPAKTVDAYILEYFIWAIVPVVVLEAVLCYKILVKYEVKNKKSVFLLAFAAFIFCPMLHCVALKGMPDAFGMVFVLLILIHTLDFDFRKVDWKNNVRIGVAAVALFITRRWYAYWIVAYLTCFLVGSMLQAILCRENMKVFFKTAGGLVLCGGGMALLVLSPLFVRILSYSYSEHYISYKFGGIGTEISRQIIYMGRIPFLFVIAGIAVGFICKRTRFLTCTMTATWLLAMFMFIRVQNAAEHQSLIYYPSYMVLSMIFFMETVGKASKGFVRIGGQVILGTAIFLNVVSAGSISIIKGNMWSYLSLCPIIREDYEEVRAVSCFLQNLIETEDAMIYIMPHTAEYNPDVFRNAYVPGSLKENISYGAGVFGTHRFPVEYLEADYILSSNPVLDPAEKGIVYNLAVVLNSMVEKGELRLVKEFPFENGITFLLYKREQAVQTEDLDELEELFSGKYEQFPELYRDILEGYREQMAEE